jgi:selenoprotein W-related protein
LAAEVKKARGVDVALVKGSGGQFEVSLDGQLLFSKKKEGRFPAPSEILEKIPEAAT